MCSASKPGCQRRLVPMFSATPAFSTASTSWRASATEALSGFSQYSARTPCSMANSAMAVRCSGWVAMETMSGFSRSIIVR